MRPRVAAGTQPGCWLLTPTHAGLRPVRADACGSPPADHICYVLRCKAMTRLDQGWLQRSVLMVRQRRQEKIQGGPWGDCGASASTDPPLTARPISPLVQANYHPVMWVLPRWGQVQQRWVGESCSGKSGVSSPWSYLQIMRELLGISVPGLTALRPRSTSGTLSPVQTPTTVWIAPKRWF